ncbi:MAG: AEC family transporter [Myxococcota bacterium]
MAGELLAIVAPVYVCAGLGYAWSRMGRRYDTELVTELITQIGAPCLVFSSLVGIEVEHSALVQMAGACAAALLSFAAIGALTLRLVGLPRRSFLAPLVFPNVGNMGLPICLFAFGPEGLALGVVFYAVTAISHFTAGQWIWSGRISFRQLLLTPLAYAALLAALTLATDASVPGWILDTTQLLGGFTIPLMQFTLGVALGQLQLGRVRTALSLSLFRIGMGLAVGAGLAWALGMTGLARGVLILDCSMPVAVFNYMLAERHGRTPSEVAGLVVLSTLISFLSIPLVLAWVL